MAPIQVRRGGEAMLACRRRGRSRRVRTPRRIRDSLAEVMFGPIGVEPL
jgi:hypothetical protein